MMAAPRPLDSILPTSLGWVGSETSTKCASLESSGTTARWPNTAMPAPAGSGLPSSPEAWATCVSPVIGLGSALAGIGAQYGGRVTLAGGWLRVGQSHLGWGVFCGSSHRAG